MKIPAPILAAAIAGMLAAGFGNAAETPSNYPEAMRWYERAAGEGVADAQFLLGRMLETGRFRPRDPKAAAGWYRRAAQQGHALAQFRLGTMYETGFGVAADPAAAARWYEKAAAQGVSEAQFNLARLYETGKGVAADKGRARMLYRRAARRGLAPAQFNLGLLLSEETDRKSQIEAAVWLTRAARAGLEGAAAARDAVFAKLQAADRAEVERRLVPRR